MPITRFNQSNTQKSRRQLLKWPPIGGCLLIVGQLDFILVRSRLAVSALDRIDYWSLLSPQPGSYNWHPFLISKQLLHLNSVYNSFKEHQSENHQRVIIWTVAVGYRRWHSSCHFRLELCTSRIKQNVNGFGHRPRVCQRRTVGKTELY